MPNMSYCSCSFPPFIGEQIELLLKSGGLRKSLSVALLISLISQALWMYGGQWIKRVLTLLST